MKHYDNIHVLLDLLSRTEAELVLLMDQRDEAFFAKAGRASDVKGIEKRIQETKGEIASIERMIATVPVTGFAQLIAKMTFAKSIFYNTSPSDPYLGEEPNSIEEMFAYYLDQDIRRMADLAEKKHAARGKKNIDFQCLDQADL